MVRKYVKKPIVVEAIQFNDFVITQDIKDFLKDSGVDLKIEVDRRNFHFGAPCSASLKRNGQSLNLYLGDFIVKGVDGSIYPVHSETFWKVYDEYNGEEKMDVVRW